MNKIYLITGPAGVGKSTISRKIAETLKKSILIDGDDIYHLVIGGYVAPWQKGNHLEFYWQNILSIITNSINNGYDIVFNYIITKQQLENIKHNFPNAEIKFICLMADDEVLIQRDKLRDLNKQMGSRTLTLSNELKLQNFNPKYILDSTNLSINQICDLIINKEDYLI